VLRPIVDLIVRIYESIIHKNKSTNHNI
ncbi:undecaprenyl-diphosphatase, partial [Bacillus sp. SIMBA_154]